MKHLQSITNEVQSQIRVISSLEAGTFKGTISEGKNNHKPKVTKFYGKIKDFTSLLKKENVSGTGYLCDNDDEHDDEFQNG
jgi:hypothetical protein